MVSVKKFRKLFFIKCNNHLALHSVLESRCINRKCLSWDGEKYIFPKSD